MSKMQLTIEGDLYELSAPYAAGHVLNEHEAAALNQTRGENVRNNVASQMKRKIKEVGDRPLTADEKSEIVNKYDAEYQFGARSQRILDPVEREARAMATELVKAAAARKNVPFSSIESKDLANFIDSILNEKPEIREKARLVVEARKSIGVVSDDGIDLPFGQTAGA